MRRDALTRRSTLQAVMGALLLATSTFALAEGEGGAPLESDEQNAVGLGSGKDGDDAAEPADQEMPEGGTPIPRKASLTVVVTGNGIPVPNAEVVLLDAARSGGDDLKDFTDARGEAVFSGLLVNGATTTVRVIVPGWVTAMQAVVLERGSQQVTIGLKPKGHGM
jgi:hypothetical protein